MTELPFLLFLVFVGSLILDLVFEARDKKTPIFKFMAVFSIMCLAVTGMITSNFSEPIETKVGTVTKYENNVLVLDEENAYHLLESTTTVPALCKVLEPGDYVEISYSKISNVIKDCQIISKAGIEENDKSDFEQNEKDCIESNGKIYCVE